jgi:hypothetical protein
MSFPPWLRTALLWLCFALFPANSARAADEGADAWRYQLGRGLRLGNSGFWLGGYASARVEDYRRAPWRMQLSDLSLFVGFEKGRWRFFSEFELGDGLQLGNHEALNTRHGYLDLERLFLDYALNEALTVRVGKFLTPIGRWNLIHADPLVWTTERPLVTAGPFAMHTTGFMLHGGFDALGLPWNYMAYVGERNRLDFQPFGETLDGFYSDAMGLRLFQEMPGRWLFGFSYAHYREKFLRPGDKNLLGLDFHWTRRRYELGGEFVYRIGDRGPHRDEWGLYLQGVAPLTDKLYAVGRYEAFRRESSDRLSHLWLGGLAYKPLPPLVFKLEYSVGIDTGDLPPSRILGGVPEGFAASVSVLF